MAQIVGIVGFIGSGKGTAGGYLASRYGFIPMSFASSLKDAVSSIFGWPRHMLEGDTPESREWREIPDQYWSQKMGKDVTPRWVLQYIGTDVMRNHFEDNIWIWSLERKLQSSRQPIVITDVRFPNEVRVIRESGGKLLWVRRNPEPSWVQDALDDPSRMRIRSDVHPSEYEWIGAADYNVIWNDSDLSTFHGRIRDAAL